MPTDFLANAKPVKGAPPADFLANAKPVGAPIAAPSEPTNLQLYERALFNPVGSGASAYPKPIEGALQVGGRALAGMIGPFTHPIKTAEGMTQTIAPWAFGSPANGNSGPIQQRMDEFTDEWKKSPALALENAGGDAIAAIEGGRMVGAGIGKATDAVPAIREAAIGNPQEAALRGMRESPGSDEHLRVLDAHKAATPYFKGTQSLEDFQARTPAVKNEIWSPYEEAVNEIGDRPVRGPDGMTTVRALEAERKELSAINRGLRTGDPQSLRVAEQKGLNQAELLQREEAVKKALDPELENVGIKPREIRKAFGHVSDLEGRTAGRTTMLEKEPYGFGKMVHFRLDPQNGLRLPEVFGGMRDIAAGRPWWSGSPTDINLREAFRAGGEKPDFGRVIPQNRLKLPAQVPFREDEFPYGDWQYGVPVGGQVTPPPRVLPALTESAGEGEAQPMVWERSRSHPGVDEQFARTRVHPNVFANAEQHAPRFYDVNPVGEAAIRRVPRGLLTAGNEERVPARGAGDTYPPGNKFRKRGK